MKQDEVTRLLYTERKSRCLTKVGLVELLSEYGLFLAKIVTVVVAIAVVVMLIVNATQRKRQRGELRVINLSDQYKEELTNHRLRYPVITQTHARPKATECQCKRDRYAYLRANEHPQPNKYACDRTPRCLHLGHRPVWRVMFS